MKELGRSVSVVWSALVEIFQNVGFTFTVVLGDVPVFQCLLQGHLSSHILKPERGERGVESSWLSATVRLECQTNSISSSRWPGKIAPSCLLSSASCSLSSYQNCRTADYNSMKIFSSAQPKPSWSARMQAHLQLDSVWCQNWSLAKLLDWKK